MEGLNNNQENFEIFKNRISETFKNEGLSENLISEIEKWYHRRREENDNREANVKSVGKIAFQVELAQIYITTNQIYKAKDVLQDAYVIAINEECSKDQELNEARTNPDQWFSKVTILRPNLVKNQNDEIQSLENQLIRTEELIQEIENLAYSINFKLSWF